MFQERLKRVLDDCDTYTLREFKNAVYPLVREMKGMIDEEKYSDFIIEYDCVKNEVIYGDDDEDSERVKQDCIESLRAIMSDL
jgi:hypothetical protein